MHRSVLRVVVLGLVVALSVGVATATAGGGNSANAKLCQKNGWMNLVRSDGGVFNNQDECVSFGAKGGTIMPKPTCTAGSDNFSGDAERSTPTTFAGGTLDAPYGFHRWDLRSGRPVVRRLRSRQQSCQRAEPGVVQAHLHQYSVLSNSARVADVSGDPAYVDRLRRLEPRLEPTR